MNSTALDLPRDPVTLEGAERTLVLFWAEAHMADLHRILLTNPPAGRAVIVRTEMATTRRLADRLRRAA